MKFQNCSVIINMLDSGGIAFTEVLLIDIDIHWRIMSSASLDKAYCDTTSRGTTWTMGATR